MHVTNKTKSSFTSFMSVIPDVYRRTGNLDDDYGKRSAGRVGGQGRGVREKSPSLV
jgi:hypothetical protein